MPANVTTIVTWVLRLAVAALFLFAAFMKLSGDANMVAEFGVVGLGDGFRYVVGILEVVGALAVLYPPTTGWGALLLLLVDVGAFLAQTFRIHQDVIHTFVIGAVLLVLFYLTRHPVMKVVGGRT